MKQRRAFTVIELLVVISIIAILMAIVAPVLSGVMQSARNAKMRSEIIGLGNGVDDFHASYGVHPPSRITLYERASDWNLPAAARSRAELRRIFGLSFDFSKNRDIDGDGVLNETHHLSGQECLVFFLGGLPRGSGASIRLIGLSKSKSDPFKGGGSSRTVFFEFDPARLVDTDNDGFPEYADQFGTGVPIAYYRDDKPYDVSHCPGALTVSTYHFLDPSSPYRPYQIVVAGRDGLFGEGGPYASDNPQDFLKDARAVEQDNMTNFHASRLGD